MHYHMCDDACLHIIVDPPSCVRRCGCQKLYGLLRRSSPLGLAVLGASSKLASENVLALRLAASLSVIELHVVGAWFLELLLFLE
jgi:hypothetical protein